MYNVSIYSIHCSVCGIHHISAHKLYCSVFNPVYCVLAEELWRLHWELLPSTQPPETLPRQQSWSFSRSQNPQNTYQKTVLVFLKFSKHSKTNKWLLKFICREDCHQEHVIKLDDDGNHQLTTCSLHQYCSWPPVSSQRAWCQGTSDQTRACLHFLISPGSVFCRFCL